MIEKFLLKNYLNQVVNDFCQRITHFEHRRKFLKFIFNSPNEIDECGK